MKAQKEIKHEDEKSILKLTSGESWIAPEHTNRFKIPANTLTSIWTKVKRLIRAFKQKIKEKWIDSKREVIAKDILAALVISTNHKPGTQGQTEDERRWIVREALYLTDALTDKLKQDNTYRMY